jgi:hypothetical protein
MNRCIFVGIDPGQNGGLAAIYPHKVEVMVMPLAGGEIDVDRIMEFIPYVANDETIYACIEKTGAMSPGKIAVAKLNFAAGLLQGILRARHIPLEVVRPQDWKKEILAGTDKSKEAAIAWCQRVFPDVSLRATEKCKTFHDGIADALAMAEYCRRKYR